MQALLTFLLFIITLVLQTKLRIIGSPDILIPLLIAFVVVNEAENSLLFAFTFGFIQDSLMAFGFINTLLKTIIAVSAAVLKHFIVLENSKLCMLFAAIFTPISTIGSIFATQSFDGGLISVPLFAMVSSTIINIMLAPFFLSLLNWINRDGQ